VEVEGHRYEFTRASDVVRDGMGLECYRVSPTGERDLVLEAFWHDPTGKFSVRIYEKELPFALVQGFVRRAAQDCPPTRFCEPGTQTLIHVRLLEEGSDVWRPATAEVTRSGGYRLTGSVPNYEQWEFAPGTTVRCEETRFDDGTIGLVAVALAVEEEGNEAEPESAS
jgi:hypothetical protein